MAGLYIHIPFCKKACSYCNFHFNTNVKAKPEVVKAIIKEIELRKSEIDHSLETVYFGGGTPSSLSNDELSSIFQAIHKHFSLTQCKEITFEVNPDDVTPQQLEFWHGLGINRISMGVQSFYEEDLKYMGRFHKAEEAVKAVKNLIDSPFTNYTIDLIYGSPTLTDAMWRKNLDFVKQNKIPHISCYSLTVEPNTKLAYRIAKTKQNKPVDDDSARQFDILQQWANENNFTHYEISNLGLKENQAIHNSNYWNGKPYLGIGPSAHSFNSNIRKWNVANNKIFIEKINLNETAYEQENLAIEDQYNEMIMIGFRTKKGVSKKQISTIFGENRLQSLLDEINQIHPNYFTESPTHIQLKPMLWMLSDGIISDLFWV